MFVLNVDLKIKAGSEERLENIFQTIFVPAISVQSGFAGTKLLRPKDTASPYRLVIEFENQSLQQAWVAQPLHQKVWPQMEDTFDSYEVHNYDNV